VLAVPYYTRQYRFRCYIQHIKYDDDDDDGDVCSQATGVVLVATNSGAMGFLLITFYKFIDECASSI